MADASRDPRLRELPEAVAAPRRRWAPQFIWIIPIVAVLAGAWLAAKAILESGPTITISFKTAESIEAGKTKLRYKDVEIGLVKAVTLADDLSHVVVTADLVAGSERYVVEDTRFWVVRTRISGGSISGLGTLLGGAYIGVDIGKGSKRRRHFTGLEVPPVIATDVPGRQFVLRAPTLGSLDTGSPIFFRRLQVGQVTAYELDPDGNGMTIKIFVNSPHERLVTANTRFWEASGIDLRLDASGIEVNTESLVAIAIGGLAFETPAGAAPLPPADADAVFTLFRNRALAMKNPEHIIERLSLVFGESLRGLQVGAPVDFRGINVGEVVSINTEFDAVTERISLPVEINLYPERFTKRYLGDRPKGGRLFKDPKEAPNLLVAKGLRAQLRSSSLVTGQLYVALDFFPNAPKAKVDWTKKPPELPTIPGGLQELQETISNIAKKIDQVDFAAIGANLRRTLDTVDRMVKSADQLVQRLDSELVGETRATLQAARAAIERADRSIIAPDASLQEDVREALREIARAADSLRALADLLERQPESLIRGKQAE